MKAAVLTLTLLLTLTGLLSCSGKPHVAVQSAVPAPDYMPAFPKISDGFVKRSFDSVRTFFYDRIRPEGFNGMMLVAKNGRIIFEHYQGMADHSADLPFSADIPMHVASISKTVTAVAVLRLVQQGKIALDKPAAFYLKGFPFPEITVRTLLNHRSGLPYYGYFGEEIWSHGSPKTNADVLEALKQGKVKLNFPSDTKFAYSNTNYAMLALIVERVTKKPFPKAMKELVLDPAGMKSSFIYEPSVKKIHARSYNSRGVLQPDTYLDLIYGDKNLYTTARDLFRFDRATYSDDFLSAEMKSQMFRGYSYEKPGRANYGLGVRMREEQGREPYFFHTGWWHGNTGCYGTMRQDTVCMVILSNHYTRRIFAINALSAVFGNYPFGNKKDGPGKGTALKEDEEDQK
jgi:CubicO group peptidase (beta-lactamase class C family)